MPDTVNIEDLIKLNPKVDSEQLQKLSEQLEKGQRNKMKRHGYDLASPINRRRVIVGQDERRDPRTIHLNLPRTRR